jgi:hypothetical protein
MEALEQQEFAIVLKEQLPKWLKEFEESTRGLMVNAESRQAWEKIKRKVEKYVERRSKEGTYYAGKQLLKEIEEALREGKMELVNKAVKWWIYDKQLYRLKTIAWTETAYAYLKATVELTKDEEEIVGYQWRLSRSHPRADICDVYANVDYGLGRGVHPKGKLPRLPAHPHCMCYLIPVVRRKGMEEKEKPTIPEKALESWAPKWLKEYAEENGLSLTDLFNFEEGRFLRKREIENLKGVLTQLRKPEVLIEKYEFRTIQDVEKLVIDFAETHKDLFFYTPKEVVVEEGKDYVMACRGYPDRTATVYINKKYEEALISALKNLRNKASLTIEDEKMLSTLWHEFIHLRTINLFRVSRYFDTTEKRLMETLTEFIARHTYDRFLNMLRPRTMPNYQKEIIEAGVGYPRLVGRFRYVLQKFNINEEEAAKELEGVLIEGVQDNIMKRLADWLGTKVDLTDIERHTILDSMVDLKRISDEEFRKEVDRHYELVKRRQRRDNG